MDSTERSILQEIDPSIEIPSDCIVRHIHRGSTQKDPSTIASS